ncbi:MAG: hypothetical protein B1H07_03180 [Campylobacteraceae bacterium 4484_166]|nr:MAG: hypothetical protein B1H07_03180 [Campylobacteraceae bacterium 4484_166]
MSFGKIDYINLLPFYVFLKKYFKSSQQKSMIEKNSTYPSNINKMFQKKQIDGAFISSIKAQHKTCIDIGIVSSKEVLSVLNIKEGLQQFDYHSNTSNILSKILTTNGKIIIGDEALKIYFQDRDKEFEDLGRLWFDRYKLPFVFATLCCTKHKKIYQNISKNFLKRKIKIPQYILNHHASKVGLTTKQIRFYLTKISYTIGYKEKKSLNLFWKLAKKTK